MMTIAELIRRTQTLHASVANSLCPDGQGGQMICQQCGNTVEITPDDVAHYLRHGWPRCCERGMRWEQEQS